MIPLFPQFKGLELTDKEEIDRLTSGFPGYSDFNFVSLWGYDVKEDLMISKLNGNLVIRFRDYVSHELFYSFIGSNQIIETLEMLINKSKEQGLSPIIKLVPILDSQSFDELNHKFKVEEDRDNNDYILSLPEYELLESSKYYRHRKLINKFSKNNPQYKVEKINLEEAGKYDEVLDLFYTWEKKKGKNRADTIHELTALKRTLKDYALLKITVLGVYIQKRLIGMIVIDTNHSNYIQSHFLKYHPDYNAVNHLLHHHLAKQFGDKKIDFINIEQDLGIEGLRKAKEGTKPIHFLKKYIISKKSTN